MWALIGIQRYYDYERIAAEETTVARFSTEKKAKEYLGKSKLKQSHDGRCFKRKSLLARFHRAYIEQEDEEPVVDPKINF